MPTFGRQMNRRVIHVLNQDTCILCDETKTGVVVREGHTCLECLVSAYENLTEEYQDNERLNKRLGLVFGTMKKVRVQYFKPGYGKYYTSETIEIPETVSGYEALVNEIPKHLRLNDEMFAVVSDSGDGKEPYIVPNLYFPKSIEHRIRLAHQLFREDRKHESTGSC